MDKPLKSNKIGDFSITVMLTEQEIQNIVSKAQKGDNNSFAVIYDLFSPRIFGFLMSRLKHRQTAEDLTHTVFVKTWSSLPSYKQGSAKFSTWLFQIANYTLIDHWRTKKDQVELSKVEHLPQAAYNPKLYEHYQFLYTAMEKLTDEHQTVIRLRFNEHFSVNETAKIMGKSHVGVRVLQHRAIKALKKLLAESKVKIN
jgi:RNA polymerase sigma-70 factor, ECF subfamily